MDNRYRPRRKWQQRTRFSVFGAGDARGMRATSTRRSLTPRRMKLELSPAQRIVMLAVLLLGMAVIVLVWFFGDEFRIHNIQVQNNQAVPAPQIISSSGLYDAHILFADMEAAATRVSQVSGVDAVRLTCAWRSGCIILVQTSPPLALWQSAANPDVSVWSDRLGHVQMASENVKSKLSIRVEEGKLPEPESVLDEQLLRALHEMIALQPQTTRYTYSNEYGLAMTDSHGWKVRLGVAEYDGAMKLKLEILNQLGDQLVKKNIKPRVVDVRYITAPYYVK